jgi:Fe2+ transport system protein FeoA
MTTRASRFPLSMASAGQTVRLVRIHAGRRLTRRLADMGLTPGVELTIIRDSGGPLLITVRDSRIALGRSMTHKLIIESLNSIP